MTNDLQSFNIRLYSLSAKVAFDLGVTAYGVDGDVDVEIDKTVLFLEITAHNGVSKPTTLEGNIHHITEEIAGLRVEIVSSGVGVSASSSLSGIFAATVSVDSSSASYRIDSRHLPSSINDDLLAGLPVSGSVSEQMVAKIGKVINSDWPKFIREDSSALSFSEIQRKPKKRSFADRLAQARQVRDAMQQIAIGNELASFREKIRGMRKTYEEKGEEYPGPSELLAETIYVGLGVRGRPTQRHQENASKWLRLHS